MAFASLTQAELREVSRDLKAIGWKLPKKGYTLRLPDGRDLVHDNRGYFFVGDKKPSAASPKVYMGREVK